MMDSINLDPVSALTAVAWPVVRQAEDRIIAAAADARKAASEQLQESLDYYAKQASNLVEHQMKVLKSNNQRLSQLLTDLFCNRTTASQAKDRMELLVAANKEQWEELKRADERMQVVMRGQLKHTVAVADSAFGIAQNAQKSQQDDAEHQMNITTTLSKLLADEWQMKQEEARKDREEVEKLKLMQAQQELAKQQEANRQAAILAKQQQDHESSMAKMMHEQDQKMAAIHATAKINADNKVIAAVQDLAKTGHKRKAKKLAYKLVKQIPLPQTAAAEQPKKKKHKKGH